jgi:hypothetical protein
LYASVAQSIHPAYLRSRHLSSLDVPCKPKVEIITDFNSRRII